MGHYKGTVLLQIASQYFVYQFINVFKFYGSLFTTNLSVDPEKERGWYGDCNSLSFDFWKIKKLNTCIVKQITERKETMKKRVVCWIFVYAHFRVSTYIFFSFKIFPNPHHPSSPFEKFLDQCCYLYMSPWTFFKDVSNKSWNTLLQ